MAWPNECRVLFLVLHHVRRLIYANQLQSILRYGGPSKVDCTVKRVRLLSGIYDPVVFRTALLMINL